MASRPPRTRGQPWTWLLALLLLAMLVWVVGQRVGQLPHVEIGVTGGGEVPQLVLPPPPVEQRAGERSGPIPAPPEQGGGGGEPATDGAVPASPEPHR